MRSHELKRAKRAIRRDVLARRDAMSPPVRAEDGARAIDRFLVLPEVTAARTVAAFWSFGSELDTAPLLAALAERGIRVALPRIEGDALTMRTWAPGDPVEPTSFGAMEPADGNPVDPADLDVVCTPGVAFDPWGGRIGYGGGYYDRLFDRGSHGPRVALAFDLQVLDEALPQGGFDRPVDVLVTPTRTIVVADGAPDGRRPDLNRHSNLGYNGRR